MSKSALHCLRASVLAICWLGSLPALADGSRISITQRWVKTSGWEQTLVRGNPNLGHFTWIPITSYPHDMGVVHPPGPPPQYRNSHRPAPTRSRHFYVKPIHVPTIIRQTSNQSETSNRNHSPIYVKPHHVPTVVGNSGRSNYSNVSSGLRTGHQANNSVSAGLRYGKNERDVYGRLSQQRVQGQLAHAGRLPDSQNEQVVTGKINYQPKVAVYDTYGSIGAGSVSGNLESKQVYGRISSGKYRRF